TLAGMHPYVKGHLDLPGEPPGYVDLRAPLLSILDVRGNVMLPRVYHLREAETLARRQAERLLERCGYTGTTTAMPAQLDQLARLRALLARALALEPHLLFVDEPFHVDIVAAWEEIGSLLHELSNGGITVVIATHNLAFIAAHAQQIVLLDETGAHHCGDWASFAASDAGRQLRRRLPFVTAADG